MTHIQNESIQMNRFNKAELKAKEGWVLRAGHMLSNKPVCTHTHTHGEERRGFCVERPVVERKALADRSWQVTCRMRKPAVACLPWGQTF